MKKFNHIMRAAMFTLLLGVAFMLQAQTGIWVNGIHYQIEYSGNIRSVKVIAASGDSYSGVVTIPQTILVERIGAYDERIVQSYTVVGIADGAFRDCSGLTGIVLPSSLKSIGKNAFYNCTGLTSVTIPAGVTSIGASAFGYCTSLTSAVVPNSVTRMDANVFYGCSSLTNVNLQANVATLTSTFQGCTALTTINMPASVKTLDGTFNGCTSLNNVTFPQSLTTIGANAFDGCSSLTNVYIPNTVVRIGNRAFAETGLSWLELPASVIDLDEDAFYGCTQLESVTVRATNPPLMANRGVFSDNTYTGASLYVPELYGAAYQSADWWYEFGNVITKSELNHPYDFEVDGTYYIITGQNTVDVTYKDTNYNSYSGTVNVPATVTKNNTTYNVTGVGNSAFRGCTALTSVNLPTSVKAIGSLAFYHAGLSGIDIPEAVTAIGDSAFYSCTGLTALTIPVNVITIGTDAFAGIAVQSLTWNARECWTNGGMTTNSLTQVTIGNEVKILPDQFARNSLITAVNFPNTLTTIGDEAFYGCSGITNLTIPVNVTSLGTDAFSGTKVTTLTWNARECWTNGSICPSYSWESNQLAQVTIGDEVEVLPNNFVRYSIITSLSIPPSVKHIGDCAFEDCKNLNLGSFVISDSVITIGYSAFSDCNITKLTIGKNVASIGENAFKYYDGWHYTSNVTSLIWNARYCESTGMNYAFEKLAQVTIGDEVECIPWGFAAQSKLTSIDLPASVKKIMEYAFGNCSSLTNVNMGNSVTEIGKSAFCGCTGLTEFTLPNSVTEVGYNAFRNCTNLTALTLSSSLRTIGEEAFGYCQSLLHLTIPASVTSIGRNAFERCDALESIVVEPENTVYDSRDNCNAVIKTANDSIVLICKNTVLPNSITEIPPYAFYGNTSMTHFDIPASVKTIGECAFYGCSNLEGIIIPAAVTSIGSNAFYNCQSMQYMQVESGNTVYDSREDCNAIIETSSNKLLYGINCSTIPASVTAIEDYAFYNCTSLTGITFPEGLNSIGDYAFFRCSGLTDAVFSDELERIGNYAFSSCSGLTNVAFSNALNSIGDFAFNGCSGLTDVTFPDGLNSIGSYAFYACTGLTSVIIPDSVTSVGSSAFCGCSGLTSVRIGESVRVIDYNTFSSCSSLEDLYIGKSVKTFNGSPFYRCSALASIEVNSDNSVFDSRDNCNAVINTATNALILGCKNTIIPNTVKRIGNSAFKYCTGLTRIVIPASVTTISDETFYECSNLTSIACLATTPPTIYYSTLSSSYRKATLMVPQASLEAYKTANYWKNFTNIVGLVGAGPGDANGDGVLGISDVTTLINALLNGNEEMLNNPYADVNGDGVVNIRDITILINMLLNGE